MHILHTEGNAHDENIIVLALVKNPGAFPTGLSGLKLRVNTRCMRCNPFPAGNNELCRVVLRERGLFVDARESEGSGGVVDLLRR